MPRKTVPLLTLDKLTGLALVGPSTQLSPDALRRARGLHETCQGELRPSNGNTILYTNERPIAITRFNDQRYYISGNILYRGNTAMLTGLIGEQMTLLRLPPGNTQRDQLFISGGDQLKKISPANVITQWGIAPPTGDHTAELSTQLTKTIELFEASGDWVISPGTVTASNETVIKQEGTNSLQIDVPANTLATVTKIFGTTLDLSLFTTALDSSNEDFVEFFIRIDATTQSFDYCTLRFDVGAGTFGSDYYQYKILPTSVTINDRLLRGIGSKARINRNEENFLSEQGGNETGGIDDSPDDSIDDSDTGGSGPGGSGDAPFSSGTWTRIRVYKFKFHRSGNSAATWSTIAAMQLMIRTNSLGPVTCYFDYARMRGGAGMLGDYRSLVTFDNTDTGHRSNSNTTSQNIQQNDRQPISYTNIPISDDPQVNARTLWRTLGNGRLFFREHVIENNTTTSYLSRVADFAGMWTNHPSKVLYLPELPTDNTLPESTHGDFIYDQATVMWLSRARTKRGRVYFSPAGRPEAQRGFIQVCQDDTPLSRLVVWNRARYAVSTAVWYRLDGTEPYTAFRFEGIPGILPEQARTLVPTPYGIIWNATDGLRRFNGSTSELFFFDRIGPLFREESLGQFSSFMGICAAFGRDQYFISDGYQTLSINLATGFIRDLGQGFTSLYYEEETRLLLGGTQHALVIVENPITPPSLPCSWETAALYAPSGQTHTILLLHIDADSQGFPIYVTLIIDGTEIPLPPLELAKRGVKEYPLGIAYQSCAVRIDIPNPQSLTRVFSINADIYTNA